MLQGHHSGLTYVSSKGDGRYCISNGKDNTCRLWDLRNMTSSTTSWRRLAGRDDALMTFKGHAVCRTLIRCHFSPLHTTGQQYVYSGSADGRIHVSKSPKWDWRR